MKLWKFKPYGQDECKIANGVYAGTYVNGSPADSVEVAFKSNGEYLLVMDREDASRMVWAFSTSPEHSIMRHALLEDVTDDFVAAVNARRRRMKLDPVDRGTIMSLLRAYLRQMGENV